MTAARLRRLLYQSARVLGDYQAVKRGLVSMARRAVRRRAYRLTGRGTARFLRALGL